MYHRLSSEFIIIFFYLENVLKPTVSPSSAITVISKTALLVNKISLINQSKTKKKKKHHTLAGRTIRTWSNIWEDM